MVKHNDYESPCRITITKHGDGEFYTLRYEDENYELLCSKDELLEELGEHLDLMVERGVKNGH